MVAKKTRDLKNEVDSRQLAAFRRNDDSVKTKLLEVQEQVEAQTNHNSSFHYIISNRVINQNRYSASSSVGLLCASNNDPYYHLIAGEN